MNNWQTKKVGEVTELHYGKGINKADRKTDGAFPVYGANGVLGRTDKFLVEGEALIVGRKGSAGEVTRISGKFWPSDVTYYIFGNDQVNIDYLFYFFKSVNLTQFARGVKPGINRNDVYGLEIPLPPLDEQKKIMKMLDEKMGKITEAKRLRAETLADTEKILSQTLREIFEEGKKKGWEEKSFDDKEILKMTSGGTPSRANDDFYNGDILWLKSGELRDNMNITESEEKISKEAVKNSSTKIFPKGTVLFAMYGATAGKIGILGVDASTNQAVAGMIPVVEKLNNKFLYYFLMKKREEIIAQAWGGAQPNLSQTILKTFSIPLPPLAEQQKIVAKLSELSEKIKTLREVQASQLEDLKKLEKAYLREAFRGELI